MTQTELLKSQAQAPAEAPKSPSKNLIEMLNSSNMKAQIALALPKHLNPDRIARIATTEIRRVPALGNCCPQSFLGAIMQCAQLGLEPASSLGHAYLLPFGNGKNRQGQANVQLIIGYKGMIDLARRSGQIISLSARAVHQGDEFNYCYGLNEDLTHIPSGSDSGALTHVYAVAKLQGGGVQFEVMTRKQVEAIRAQSKAGDKGPWVTHFEEMAKKTVIRRLFKYLPVSIEIQRAVSLDEQAEAGIDQRNDVLFETGEIFEADYTVVENNAAEDTPQ